MIRLNDEAVADFFIALHGSCKGLPEIKAA
jgi:hypothetical protein